LESFVITASQGLLESLLSPNDGEAEVLGFDESLADIRQEFAENILTEEESMALISKTLKLVRAQQRDDAVMRSAECRNEFS